MVSISSNRLFQPVSGHLTEPKVTKKTTRGKNLFKSTVEIARGKNIRQGQVQGHDVRREIQIMNMT